jgi:phosphomannomutase / phosphoglucomutase
MNISKVIFRENDIRGLVGSELSEEFSYLLGRAYGELARERGMDRIAIGWDCRPSSPGYARSLARGIADEGLSVLMGGMGPTPLVYYMIAKLELGGGIQVTGSHNPPEMNGFKICIGSRALSGGEIQELYTKMVRLRGTSATAAPGSIEDRPMREAYVAELIADCKPHMGPRKLKVVVDAGNGVGGITGPEVLKGLGVEVIELFCEPDGTFPNHHPDPTVLEYIQDLVSEVKRTRADVGIGWDGDADRIGVVDENGQIIFGDLLMLIYARRLLTEQPGATIIGDVKCSSRLFDEIARLGGTPIMWKTGHSLVKSKLRETNGDLAGEMSGHIFFKHRYYGFDDAVYATCRLLEILSHHEGPVSSLLAGVPPMVSTPEIRVDCPEEVKFKIPEAAKEHFKEYPIDTTDGVRILLPEGWALIRASNTQPVLVLRFEANSEEHLEEYRRLVTRRLETIKSELAVPAEAV